MYLICPTVFRFQYEPVAVCDQIVGSWSSRHATARACPMNSVASSARPSICGSSRVAPSFPTFDHRASFCFSCRKRSNSYQCDKHPKCIRGLRSQLAAQDCSVVAIRVQAPDEVVGWPQRSCGKAAKGFGKFEPEIDSGSSYSTGQRELELSLYATFPIHRSQK